MAAVEVRFNEAALQRLFQSKEGASGKYLTNLAIRVSNRAKQLAPVDTGRLRDSIFFDVGRGASGHLTAHVGTNVEYAPYVEFGTRFWAGQPFLIPAFMEVINNARSRV